MKPRPSPILSAAFGVFALALWPSLAPAQQTTTDTETTVTTRTVTREDPRSRVTTEIDFLPASTANDINMPMLRDFGNVTQGDPRIATDVARDPQLVDNDGYVGKHPSLRAFLEKYPDARQEIVDSPGNFVTPVPGSRWNSHQAADMPRD